MKQGKLPFTSSKRTTAAAGAKKKGSVTSSHSQIAEVKEVKTPIEQEDAQKHLTPRNASLEQDQNPAELRLELNIKDPRWRKLFADAKRKRNGLPLGASGHI
jgi:DNA polymerase delta subunit 4